jgi:CheY-like chemotaxis protein
MPQILTLNDNPIVLKLIHSLLSEVPGYQHLYTTDSYHALSISCQQPIDLLIQDILRPDMNGFELYWRCKILWGDCESGSLLISSVKLITLKGVYRERNDPITV